MKFVLIDSSQPTAQVALAGDGAIIAYTKLEGLERRGGKILKTINDLLEANQLQKEDIDAVGWVSGFGSFTGLRVAGTVANGFGYALDIPVIGSSWFEILAEKTSDERVIVWQNPRGDYFQIEIDEIGKETPEIVDDREAIRVKSERLFSNDSELNPDILIDELIDKELFANLAGITQEKFTQLDSKEYEQSKPEYFRPPVEEE